MKEYVFLGALIFELATFSLVAQPLHAEAVLPEVPYGYVSGYTDNVDDEISSEPKEMLLIQKPPEFDGPSLHDIVFDPTLTNEFVQRYQEAFGRTEQEENYFLINKQGYYITPTGPAATQKDDARRAFAEYMVKRLAEYHTENVMKTDPKFRKVYEVKQAISNVQVKVTQTTRFDMSYSFVGNSWRGTVSNPIVSPTVTVYMDPNAYYPTMPTTIDLALRRPITDTSAAEVGYNIYNYGSRLILTKRVGPNTYLNLSESLTLTADWQVDSTKEILTLAGFTVTF